MPYPVGLQSAARQNTLYALKATYKDSPAAHALLVGNGASAINTLAPGAARNFAISDGADWASRAIASLDLTTALTTPPAIGGTTPDAGSFTTITGTLPGSITYGDPSVANYVYQLTLRNTLDTTPSPDDYGNEVHLRLRAGTVSDHRAYINFADFNGTDKWLTGRNGSNVWILYNSDTVHRLWFEPISGTFNSGANYINSASTGAVRINYSASEDVGTGGLEVWSGGDHTLITRLHVFNANGYTQYLSNGTPSGTAIDATGHLGLLTAPISRYTQVIGGTTTLAAGGSFGGVLANPIYDPTGNTTQGFYGVNATAKAQGTFTFNQVVGGGFIGEQGSTGAAALVYGGLFIAQTTSGVAAPVTNGYAGNFIVKNAGSGTWATAYGIYVDTATNSGGGAITTNYGLRILDQTAGGTNFGIRTGLGQNLLGDATTVKISDTGTASVPIIGILDHDITSGTPADGIGGELSLRSRSNNIASRNVGAIDWLFSTAADASRVGDLILYAYNITTKREALRIRGGASNAQIGFLGATPVSRQTTYTQTYSTTTSTVNPSATSAFTGQDNAQAGSVYAKLTDLNTLRTDMLMAMQLINKLIDDSQAYGLAS